MAKIKIEITEDMLKLISNIKFQQVPLYAEKNNWDDYDTANDGVVGTTIGIDLHSLYGGNFVLEDISRILGMYDKHIKGTENDWLGPRFEDSLEDYMFHIHYTIVNNLTDIEEIMHQFVTKGGLKPGIYICKDYEHIWKYKESK